MDDQRKIEHLETVPTVPLAALPYQGRRRRRGQSPLFIGAGLLLITGLVLIMVWGNEVLLASSVLRPVSTTARKPRPPQARTTPGANAAARNALIASQVDNLLSQEVAHQQFRGSVLIARKGQVLLSKGYGMADWDNKVPNTPHTRFYLGSTTKQFTAMAILILQQRGKLQVRDHLCSHIVACPAAWQLVTIFQMLTHTSGIPQLPDSQLSAASPQAWIDSYAGVPLAFPAGSKYSYCNVCYQILGYVVEQVSGEPYSKFLQQAIFDPVHMKNTGFDARALEQSPHAVGYASWREKATSLEWSPGPQWSFLFGAGLLYSTVEDLFRWDQALYAHTFISQQVLNEAFTPYSASQYAGSRYGFGWFVTQAPRAGHRLIWHDGRIDGFRTYIGRYVDDGITIIFLSNLATVDERALANSLGQIVYTHI